MPKDLPKILLGNANKRVAILLLIVFLLAHPKYLTAIPFQSMGHPAFRQFTVDDGLPSNRIYHISQDSEGYIWIGTSNGASRFDGYGFQNFSLLEGMSGSNIVSIYPDSKGRIWFLSQRGTLCYLKDDSISPYPFNNRIQNFLPNPTPPLRNCFYVDDDENVHLSLKGYGLILISPEGIHKHRQGVHREGVLVFDLYSPYGMVSLPENPIRKEIIIIDKNDTIRVPLEDLKITDQQIDNFFLIELEPSTYILTINRNAYRIKNGSVVSKRTYRNTITWAGLDSNGQLWIAPKREGVYGYSSSCFEVEHIYHLLEKLIVNSVLVDHEGGYWVATDADGLFYFPNIKIVALTASHGLRENRVTTVFANTRGVFVGYESGGLDLISSRGIDNIALPLENSKPQYVNFIGVNPSSPDIWVCTRNNIYRLGSLRTQKITIPDNEGISPSIIIASKDNGYWVGTSTGIVKIQNQKVTYSSHIASDYKGDVLSLFEERDNSLLIGCSNGLYRYSNGRYSYLGWRNRNLSKAITSIVGTPDGKVWIGTKGAGILIMEGDKVSQLSESDGLASNSINYLLVHENDVWVSTSNGINRIDMLPDGGYSIGTFNLLTGLPTNDTKGISINGDCIFIATSRGVAVSSISSMTPFSTASKPFVTKIHLDNERLSQASNVELRYGQNLLKIDYLVLSYRNMGRTLFRYRMDGLDTTWVETRNRNALFSHLPKGKYQFVLQANGLCNEWSDPVFIPISIKPPYWQTLWFLVLSALAFSILIFWIFRIRISSIKRRNDLINSINIYKQQSLKLQMNPHFIFNTLNSIQLYILQRDPISSHKYLTMFAKLMRMTLDNVQQTSITLKEEIDALRLYLDLETLRLENRISYSIELADDSLLRYKVPTLLIQPFVENSIWHGIMLKKDLKGVITIKLAKENRSILCSIIDDGVGREAAHRIKKRQDEGRQSLGLKITSQRIDILSTLYRDKLSIKYIDLLDSDNKSCGTQVDIYIPMDINEQNLTSG